MFKFSMNFGTSSKPLPSAKYSRFSTNNSYIRGKCVPSVVARAENKGNPLFSDNGLAKSPSRPQTNGTEAHASTKNEYPVSSASISSARLLDGISSKEFDRYLNIGVVVAAAVVGVGSVIAAGPNPWVTYQEAVTMNPIETKACISGVVYSLGDLIAQFYEGRDISEWDRGRIIRSGLCGLLAHGPLSHLYYITLDHAFAQQAFIAPDSWLVPFMKVGIDQTAWSIFWNGTYYVLLGALKMESPQVIAATVKNSWWDLLKAGWRLWPLVHIFTYGAIPVQHRLLFVDAVELVWCSILSVYGQQQRQKMMDEENGVPGFISCPLPGIDGEGGDAVEEMLRGIATQSEVVFESANGDRIVVSAEDVYRGGEAVPIPIEIGSSSGSMG